MPAFHYTAVDKEGNETKSSLEGDTSKHVRTILREQGLLPLLVKEIKADNSTKIKINFTQNSLKVY